MTNAISYFDQSGETRTVDLASIVRVEDNCGAGSIIRVRNALGHALAVYAHDEPKELRKRIKVAKREEARREAVRKVRAEIAAAKANRT